MTILTAIITTIGVIGLGVGVLLWQVTKIIFRTAEAFLSSEWEHTYDESKCDKARNRREWIG